MNKLWQQVREFIPMAAIILLCLVIVPSAQAGTGYNGSTATATQQTSAPPSSEAKPSAAKPKAAAKPASKSVLDAEVLDSPFAYFKDAFFSEEADEAATPSSGAVVVTVKALVAALLSSIL